MTPNPYKGNKPYEMVFNYNAILVGFACLFESTIKQTVKKKYIKRIDAKLVKWVPLSFKTLFIKFWFIIPKTCI